MCISQNQPGGPRRCPQDCAARSAGATAVADRAEAVHAATTADATYEESNLRFLELQRMAIMGELDEDQRNELAQHAAARRAEKADQERAAAAAAAPAEADAVVDAPPNTYDPDNTDDPYDPDSVYDAYDPFDPDLAYDETESDADRAAEALHDEWAADVASGVYIRSDRNDELDRARADLNTLDPHTARLILDDRLASPEHQQLIADRDAARAREHEAQAAWDTAKDSDNVEDIAVARDALFDAHADHLIARDNLRHQQNVNAQYAAHIGTATTLDPHTADTLGQCVKAGEHAPGSRAALEAQQQGIPNADIAAVLGVKDDTSSRTSTDAKNAAINPLDDDALRRAHRAHTQHTGAAGHDAAWKAVTAADFAANNPDVTVMGSTATWRNKHRDWQQVTVDGITSSDGTTPDGVLIAKTSSDAAAWADGPPPAVRAEAANALDATRLSHAHIAVRIDDHDYREYRINAGEPLAGLKDPDATIAGSHDKIGRTWQRWQDEKNNPPAPKTNSGRFDWVKAPKSPSSEAKNAQAAAELASYRGISRDEARTMITAKITAGDDPDTAIRSLYSSYSPAKDLDRRYLSFDIETNSLAAGKGEIIQSGAVVMNGRGEIVERIDELHGIDPRTARTTGTGAKDVHKIDYQDLHGRPPFRESNAKRRLAELLADPKTTMVAHNAAFESRYLAANGLRAERVIDTMKLSSRFDHASPNAKLSSFTAAHGVEYADAHNAYRDADMTARALLGFWKTRAAAK